MNVNDLHPKFQLDLTDTEKSPDIIVPSESWSNAVVDFAYFSIEIPDVPTKKKVTFNLSNEILTIEEPTAPLPSFLYGTIKMGRLSAVTHVEKIKFTFSDSSVGYWEHNDSLTFSRIGNTNTYKAQDNYWIYAATIEAIYSIFGMEQALALDKNMLTGIQLCTLTSSSNYQSLFFNYYPSGLLIRVESRKPNSGSLLITCNLQKHYLTVTRGTLISITLCSPVPKIYCFFDSNNTNFWTVTNGSWNYNNNTLFWEQQISFSQSSNIYYFPLNMSPSIEFTKMLFIDPMLWDYRDARTVNENQTADDIALYPICKTEGTNTYFINNVSLSGTYNFLTSYGALYQYSENQINKLKDGYITIESENGQYDIGGINDKDHNFNSQPVVIHNRQTIPVDGATVYPQYGSIKNKAIMRDNCFRETDYGFRADNNTAPLVKLSQNYTINHPYILETNRYDTKTLAFIDSSTPWIVWLDEHHLWVKNSSKTTIYRVPKDMSLATYVRWPNIDSSMINGYQYLADNKLYNITGDMIGGSSGLNTNKSICVYGTAIPAQFGSASYAEMNGPTLCMDIGNVLNHPSGSTGISLEQNDSCPYTTFQKILSKINNQWNSSSKLSWVNKKTYQDYSYTYSGSRWRYWIYRKWSSQGYSETDTCSTAVFDFPSIRFYYNIPTLSFLTETSFFIRDQQGELAWTSSEKSVKEYNRVSCGPATQTTNIMNIEMYATVKGEATYWVADSYIKAAITIKPTESGVLPIHNSYRTMFLNPNYVEREYGNDSLILDYSKDLGGGSSAGMDLSWKTTAQEYADQFYCIILYNKEDD